MRRTSCDSPGGSTWLASLNLLARCGFDIGSAATGRAACIATADREGSVACSRRADCERRDQRETVKRGGGFTGAVRRASKGASSLTRRWTTSRRQRFSTSSSLEARREHAADRSVGNIEPDISSREFTRPRQNGCVRRRQSARTSPASTATRFRAATAVRR